MSGRIGGDAWDPMRDCFKSVQAVIGDQHVLAGRLADGSWVVSLYKAPIWPSYNVARLTI